MQWLRRLAPIDWEETTQAIAECVRNVVRESRSKAFSWAYFYAMNFSGDPTEAALAEAVWPRLHDGSCRIVRHAWDGLCEVNPLDFDAPAPSSDLSEVRQKYFEWCSQTDRPPILMRRADTAISRARQILCRFAPDWAAHCHRAFAQQAPKVTNAAPAVVASFVAPDTAILGDAESSVLLSWLRRLLANGPLKEPNRETPALLLATILPRLIPEQQFAAVTETLTDERHPFWLEYLMQPLTGERLTARLAVAAAQGEAALRYGLIFAGAKATKAETVLSFVAACLASDKPLTRGIALRTLIRLGAQKNIERFACGDWKWSGVIGAEHAGEDFCGSLCLVKALGSYDDPALLERVHPVLWSRAVLEGDTAVARAVGQALTVVLSRETLLLWLAEDAPMIETIRRQRLDRAMSDDILASHAVAAAMAGRHNQMKAYILERAESRRPAVMARALTLAGFSAADEAFDALFSQARFVDGFLGEVRASAQEAYRRAISAERWYLSALAAESPLDVWRFSELAAAAADARCVLWMEEGSGSDWFEKTRPIFRNALTHSADSAERDRKRNLFGERAPPESLTSAICS